MVETPTNQLTGAELDRATEAVETLLTINGKVELLEKHTAAKLDTLRADLAAEQEDRRSIANH